MLLLYIKVSNTATRMLADAFICNAGRYLEFYYFDCGFV